MALITCPECGKEISDTAKHCVHCGYNMESYYIYIRPTYQINPATLASVYTSVFGFALSEQQLASMVQSRIVWTGKDLKETQRIARKLAKRIPIDVSDNNKNSVYISSMKGRAAEFILYFAGFVVGFVGIIISLAAGSKLGGGVAAALILFFLVLALILYGLSEILNCLYRIDERGAERG